MAAIIVVATVATVAAGLVSLAPVAGAATNSFSLSLQSGSTWAVAGNTPANVFPAQSGAALAGQVDPATGTFSAATLTLPPQVDVCNVTGCTTFKWYETNPGSATGSIDSDGNVTINDSLTIELDVITVAETCETSPVNVTFHSTAPYDPSTGDVTVVASDFTIPDFTTFPSCSLAYTQLNGLPPNGVAGSVGNNLTLNLQGTLPIPPPPGTPSATSLAVSPTSPQLMGTSVTMTAAITSDDTPPADATGTIEFSDGTTVLNTQTVTTGTTTYSFTTTSLPGGTDQLTAAYSGGSGYQASTSDAVAYVVTPLPSISANLPPTITVPTASAQPTVAGISPNAGPAAGGTVVTITGTGFLPGTTVDFGSTPATTVVVVSSASITATSPAGTGVADVTVGTANDTSATSPADQFAYGAPTVTGVSPNIGPLAGGAAVTITGTHFVPGATVNFGSASATSVTVTSSTSITALAPAVSAGAAVDVTVTTPEGTSATSADDQFTYTSTVPIVTELSKASGPAAGGTAVTITGGNFSGATAVHFGTVAVAIASDTATSIGVTSPAGTLGTTVDVTVTTPSGTSATSALDQFFYGPPTVTGVSPNSGVKGGTVTVTGTGFTGATAVKFGTASLTATKFTVNSPTSITTFSAAFGTGEVPAGTGTVDVTVTTPGGTSATSAADQFTYAPTVTAISPPSGPTAGGTSVTITGTSFTGATGVTFGATPATGVVVNSSTSITATAPSGTAGSTDVTVTTPAGTSPTSPADQFFYGAPTVTAVSPDAGPITGGTTVTITGTGLAGATAVKFGTTAATGVVATSPTSITAISPAGTSGLTHVVVTTSGGSSSSTAAASGFTYNTAPSVTLLTPNTGSPNGGTGVTITGANFTGAAAVYFGTTPATGVTVVSPTLITALSPPGSGTVDVTVTSASGTSATWVGDQFGYGAPTVTAVTPDVGSVTGGTTVTVTGTGFVAGATVTFGTTAATNVTVTSPSSLTAVSPASGAGSVDVTVTTPGGTSAATPTDQFIYSVGGSPTSLSFTVTNPSTGQAWNNLYAQVVLGGITGEPSSNVTLLYQDSSGGWCPLAPVGTTTTFTYNFSGVGSTCSAPGSFSLAPGASLTVPLQLSYASATYLGPQSVTATLLSGTCTSPTSCTQSGSLNGNVTTAGTIDLAPVGLLASTTTDPNVGNATGRPATLTVRQGFYVSVESNVAATVPATGVPTPTGTVQYTVDGNPISVIQGGTGAVVSAAPLNASGTTATTGSAFQFPTYYSTAGLAPGTHTLVSQYSGDAVFAPSSLTETFTVLPASGTLFSCTASGVYQAHVPSFAAYVTATGTLPSPTPSGGSALVTNISVTVDFDPVIGAAISEGPVIGTLQSPAAFGLSPSGSTSGGPATFTGGGGADTATDSIGTWTGMSGSIPVTGSPGSTEPVGVGLFGFTYYNGTEFNGSVACSPASAPTSLGSVTVAGTTLTASPAGPVVAGTPVTLTAQAEPAPTSNPGTVEFFDGSTSLGTVAVSPGGSGQPPAGQASLTTSSLASGDHQLTAVWSGTLSISANTSNQVSLDVGTAPAVTTQPGDQTVNAGQTATFTAAASGAPDPMVQWQLSTDGGSTWSNIDGATSATYTTPATTAANNGNQYQAVFTNGVGTPATSNAATLSVQSAPAVTIQPTSQTVASGQSVTFTAAASGNPAPTVQWQVSTDGGGTFTNVSGATSATLSFTAASAQNDNQYRAVFSNGVSPAATTHAATLTVNDAPQVTTQPGSQSASAGQSVTFAVAGTGKPAPSIQWQVSTDGGATFANITGATSASLTLTPGTSASGNQYRAVLANSAGVTPSNAATLTVLATDGYRLVGADGSVFTYGTDAFYGSMGGKALAAPIVGMAATPDDGGYWLVASDGGIFAFGDAAFYGSMGGQPLNKPIVGIASTPDGQGYWLVASDGGIFAFGDAAFYGSTGSLTLNKPVVGMAATPDGQGYWLVASDGGIFAFGDAAFYGSMGGTALNAPITGIATTPNGTGYWLVASDGGIFTFGNAGFFGAASAPSASVVAMVATPNGAGYWEFGADGSVYGRGNAQLSGSQAGQPLGAPIVGAAT